MKYIGLQSQIWRNNTKSTILLILFPLLLFVLTYLFAFFTSGNQEYPVEATNNSFFRMIPWVTIGVIIWFLIAYFSHSSMIMNATGSKPLERKQNKRVYNLAENLCIASGMKMPKINIINDDSLNAFASGLNKRSYSISLSRGIIDKLNDEELEGVIAHELTHIRNRDVRLLIVSIIFVGIFAFLAEMFFRTMLFSGGRRKEGGTMIIGLILAIVGYFFAILFRFAISRKREYMADAGGAQLTKNPQALASALRKISVDSRIEAVKRQDVAQLFIDNPQEKKKKKTGMSFASLFATHPPIKERIRLLEQF